MQLAEVIANLERTIASKTEYLTSLRADIQYYGSRGVVDVATEGFLNVNIYELKLILADLKKVQP